LALTSYYEQIAEFGLLHAVGSLANTSGEAAVEICQRTIAQLKEQEISPQIRAGLYAELGAALNFIGESEEALGHVLAARKIYEQLGDSLRVFWTDVLVGQCYSVQKKSEKAQAYFHKAILAMEALNLGASLELCDAYNASAYYIYYNQKIDQCSKIHKCIPHHTDNYLHFLV
jgi:tetratricopeptide (TPR) repeat protein